MPGRKQTSLSGAREARFPYPKRLDFASGAGRARRRKHPTCPEKVRVSRGVECALDAVTTPCAFNQIIVFNSSAGTIPSAKADGAAEQARREREAAQTKTDHEREEAFQALWDSLSDADKQTIEAQVLLTLNTFARNAYRKEQSSGKVGPGHHALRNGVQKLFASKLTTSQAVESRE